MSNLYEEAIADAKKLRELALATAQAELAKRIEPKLRKIIDEQLINEAGDEPAVKPKDGDDDSDLILDLSGDQGENPGSVAGAEEDTGISLPDEEGKVTIDLDKFVIPGEGQVGEPASSDAVAGIGMEGEEGTAEDDTGDEISLSNEAVQALTALLGAKNIGMDAQGLRETIDHLESETDAFAEAIEAGKSIDRSQIVRAMRGVRDTYFGVRGDSSLDTRVKHAMEQRLESLNRILGMIVETDIPDAVSSVAGAVKKTAAGVGKVAGAVKDAVTGDDEDENKKETNESEERMDDNKGCAEADKKEDESEITEADLDLTIKADVDDELADELADALSGASVDVTVGDEGEEGAGDDLEGLEGGDEGGDELAGLEGLSDDDVVDVDENVLRTEIRRLRRRMAIREGKPGAKEFAAFGGGHAEGEAMSMDDGDLNKNESHVVRRLRRENRRAAIRESQLRREVRRLTRALSEHKLFAAKVTHANKLLQTEGLTDAQKSKIVESLDKARTEGEVARMYTSMKGALSKKSTVNETRVPGSASRATGKPAAKLNESKEEKNELNEQVNRWGTLAGI